MSKAVWDTGVHSNCVCLRTGDLGFFYQDQLFLAGRIKDVIIVRGRNYFAHDIERTTEEVHPGLRPGCGAAFGIEVEGDERLVVSARKSACNGLAKISLGLVW